MKRLLVVDDDWVYALGLKCTLAAAGYDVQVCNRGAEAVRRASSEPFDLLLVDVLMPEKDGIEVLMELRRSSVTTPILMMSGSSANWGGSLRAVIRELSALEMLEKPFSREILLRHVAAALAPQSGNAGLF
jgi:DNA-binding response OmpR family regulator